MTILKLRVFFFFFGPLCKDKAFSRVLTYTVGKVLAIPFRNRIHIVQKHLGTMKIVQLKAKFIFYRFWTIVQKPDILPCYNIHRWKGLGKNFQNQKSHCVKRSWNYKMFEIESRFFFLFAHFPKIRNSVVF